MCTAMRLQEDTEEINTEREPRSGGGTSQLRKEGNQPDGEGQGEQRKRGSNPVETAREA
jgi:hypothetical protein